MSSLGQVTDVRVSNKAHSIEELEQILSGGIVKDKENESNVVKALQADLDALKNNTTVSTDIFDSLTSLKDDMDKVNYVYSKFIASNLKYLNLNYIDYKIQKDFEFIIVGAGGTGGWFIPKLIKILNDSIRKDLLTKATVTIIDGDEVEEKNLIRQNFINRDIGKNKADVLASRYSQLASENITVQYIDKYIYGEGMTLDPRAVDKFIKLDDILGLNNTRPRRKSKIFINLIDNAKSRKAIHLYAETAGIDVIDVANNKFNGQLNFSMYSGHTQEKLISNVFLNEPELLYANDDISIFNCADTDATEDQIFSANDIAATMLSTYVCNLINDDKINYTSMKFMNTNMFSCNSSGPIYPLSYSGNSRIIESIEDFKNSVYATLPSRTNTNADTLVSDFYKFVINTFGKEFLTIMTRMINSISRNKLVLSKLFEETDRYIENESSKQT